MIPGEESCARIGHRHVTREAGQALGLLEQIDVLRRRIVELFSDKKTHDLARRAADRMNEFSLKFKELHPKTCVGFEAFHKVIGSTIDPSVRLSGLDTPDGLIAQGIREVAAYVDRITRDA